MRNGTVSRRCHAANPTPPGDQKTANRLLLKAALWLARTGAPWCDLRQRFRKWNPVF